MRSTFESGAKLPAIVARVGYRVVSRCAVDSYVALSVWQPRHVESPTAVAGRTGCGHASRATLPRVDRWRCEMNHAPNSAIAITATAAMPRNTARPERAVGRPVINMAPA